MKVDGALWLAGRGSGKFPKESTARISQSLLLLDAVLSSESANQWGRLNVWMGEVGEVFIVLICLPLDYPWGGFLMGSWWNGSCFGRMERWKDWWHFMDQIDVWKNPSNVVACRDSLSVDMSRCFDAYKLDMEIFYPYCKFGVKNPSAKNAFADCRLFRNGKQIIMLNQNLL